MIANAGMLFVGGCCSVCGAVIPPLRWHNRADGIYSSARETHFEFHRKRGETL